MRTGQACSMAWQHGRHAPGMQAATRHGIQFGMHAAWSHRHACIPRCIHRKPTHRIAQSTP
eukprot:50890-Chlamydomonas_euryale.AAC.4